MEKKELSLEELVAASKAVLVEKKNKTLNNIKKLQQRANAAEGEEKARLEALVALHSNHYQELEAITDESIEETAQLRFNKISSEKTYEKLV